MGVSSRIGPCLPLASNGMAQFATRKTEGQTMKFKILSIGAAAMALAATPVLAEAGLAQRTASPVEESEGFAPAVLIGVLAVTAIVTGAILVADDSSPTSP